MTIAKINDIDMYYEEHGDPNADPLLLIMGFAMSATAWGLQIPALAQRYHVIAFDNRGVGRTTQPDAAYSVPQMAADAAALLDHLGIDSAHIVGVSMGGMIAQWVAIAAPQRVLSLTSIMSSSGARGLPEAKPAVLRALLSRPKGKEREHVIDHFFKVLRIIGSPGFPIEDDLLRERIATGTDRNYHPAGSLRQMMAIAADTPARATELARISSPTLVLHGKADPLVPYGCGEDTARRIPGAKLVGIEGMGHDLAPGVVERILPPMIAHMRQYPATATAPAPA